MAKTASKAEKEAAAKPEKAKPNKEGEGEVADVPRRRERT